MACLLFRCTLDTLSHIHHGELPVGCAHGAEALSKQIQGRKGEVILALVALDRARVFQLARAKELMIEELRDNVVKDPVDAEILETERIAGNLLPETVLLE